MAPPEPIAANVQIQSTGFSVEAFDLNVSTWSRWVTRLETALDIFNCDTNKKKNYLLHYMGFNTYNLLCDKLLPETPETKTYEEIKRILGEYYDPKPNEILENYRFHLRKQKEEESCEEYLIGLRKMAIHCNFGAYLNTALRNQFVFGLKNQKIQSRLLEKSELTLETALTTAKAFECAEKGGVELQQPAVNESTVNLVSSSHRTIEKKFEKTPKAAKRNCYRCGNSQHLANECRHKETVCSYCMLKGHLRRVCMKEKRQLNQIEEGAAGGLSDEMLQIYEGEVKKVDGKLYSDRSKLFCNLKVNNTFINFEIDTGAPVTIVSVDDAEKYFGKLRIHDNDTDLFSFCDNKLPIVGFLLVSVQLSANTVSPPLKLYLVNANKRPLLGREWLRNVKLNWVEIFNKKIDNVHTINVETDAKTKLHEILKKYAVLQRPTAGKITGHQARINIKPESAPKFFKARRVPFSLMDSVERELERQVAEGLLIKVESSEWATPIVVVPKKNASVRICGDYKITINPVMIVDEHPLPTIEELFSTMSGGKKFTKIDLSQAYLQLEVHPDDRKFLTINTHKGLFMPTRMMFGVACAPAKWQRFIEQLLRDIPGVSVFLDDIKITAENDEIHLKRIEEVLKRLADHNMRINVEKSDWMKDEIEYCGYKINKNGIGKMKEKITAIQNMKRPTNVDEVRAFVGMINYYGRFIQHLSTILYPINNLLKKGVPFIWNKECEKSFHDTKIQMQSDIVLVHYNPNMLLVLAVDASPYGVGAVLSHRFPDGSERPIQFASQTLSSTQQKYSQIDKEAYAIVFGVTKFYQYLFGRKFILITDNKPVAQIFSPTKGLPTLSATRMQHYAIFLQSFDYEIEVKRSQENANADAISRLPENITNTNVDEVNTIEIERIQNLPVTVSELSKETLKEKEVHLLMDCLKYGRQCPDRDRFGIQQTEFSLQQGCLLRGLRVYIPPVLRKRVLQELHSAHFGMNKMKSLARGYCWWPKLDSDIENLVKNCMQCQITRAEPAKQKPIHSWNTASKPFERVHVDFAGPILGKYLFVLVDAFTKWPEVYVISNITAETTIEVCREIFSRMGIPNVLVSDHGTQFHSGQFQKFLKDNGIKHKQGAPYHPATNGLAERFVQTIKNKLKSLKCTPQNLKSEVSKILLAYRRSIHMQTGSSPAMLMLGRQIQNRLDLLLPQNSKTSSDENATIAKSFEEEERVAVRDYLTNNKWQFGRITKRIGQLNYEVLLDDGRLWQRHVDQIRKVGSNLGIVNNEQMEERLNVAATEHERQNNEMETAVVVNEQELNLPSSDSTSSSQEGTGTSEQDVVVDEGSRRPERIRNKPKYLEDFEIDHIQEYN